MCAQRQQSSPLEETYDVVVVGFGGAGACAAIAAADAGASVLILDRFYGGGSTTHSGGVVYAGGGTAQQEEAGIVDSPEATFNYLRREVRGAVTDETLQRFANSGPEMIEWLQRQGLEFEGSLCPYKTSYPTNRHYLYYSGNELVSDHNGDAPPAPRGHRMLAKNFSGAAYFSKLRDSVYAKGVTVRNLADVQRLIVEDGHVTGVEYQAPPPDRRPGKIFAKFTEFATKMQIWSWPIGAKLNRSVVKVAQDRSVRHRAHARGGVVLATGGHGFDQELVGKHSPAWLNVYPLGTIGDDGAALRLASEVNAATGHLDKMSGWRFIAPPSAFMEGIVVNRAGERFTNEQYYGATMAEPMVEKFGGEGYLVVDARTWRKARSQLREQTAFFHAPQMLWMFTVGHTKAASLRQLAGKLGVDPGGLQTTVDTYTSAAEGGQRDEFGKHADFHKPLRGGPYYAVRLEPNTSTLYPCLFITLGGLVVDEETGAVQRVDGEPVSGLYAAGRSAVGICSNSYISGLALADTVFSGRRAGEHAVANHAVATTNLEEPA